MIIKEWLVRLGYTVDGRSEQKLNESVKHATANVVNLGAAMEAAAVAVAAALVKMADGLEQFYYASIRTGATVESLKAIGYAASQMGSSAGAAQSSMENLARFLRSSPGASKMLNSLGIATDGRGADKILTDFAERTRSMPYYRALAYANALGIDERTLMAAREGLNGFGDEYRRMLRAAGVDADKAAQASHGFMTQVRGLWAAFGILGDKVGLALLGHVSGDIARFRALLTNNFGRISEVIETVAKFLLNAGDVITRVLQRIGQATSDVMDWFKGLDSHTKAVIETVGGLIVAWRLLNAGFLASPIGLVITLGAALLLLYDDYKTWKEGGKSLIDWTNWGPEVERAWNYFKVTAGWLDQLTLRITGPGGLHTALEGLLVFVAGRWLTGMLSAFSALSKAPPLLAILAAVEAAKWLEHGNDANGSATVSPWRVFLNDNMRNPIRSMLGLPPLLADGQDLLEEPNDKRPDDLQRWKNQQESFKFWMDAGKTAAQASGMVAQEQAESNFDPNGVGDSGTAGGQFQWHKDRRDAILKGTGIDVWKAGHLDQLKAALWELTHGGEQKAGHELDSAQTAAEASNAGVDFERPHDLNGARIERAAMAETAYSRLAPIPGAAPVQVNQTNNTTVHGANDPDAVAAAVSRAHFDGNADLLRNMQGATR